MVVTLPRDSSTSLSNEGQVDCKVHVYLCQLVNEVVIKVYITFRIEKARQEDMQVCDVDGSYLYRKQQRAIEAGVLVSPMDIPDPPISGWEQLTSENHKEISSKVPSVMPGTQME